jgi:peptidyl-prolyl cis-trans isomerase C
MFPHIAKTARVRLAIAAIAAIAASLFVPHHLAAQTDTQTQSGSQSQPQPQGVLPDSTITVVATVGEETVYLAEILQMAQRLPEQYKKLPLPTVYPGLLQRAINARLIASAGRAAGYAENAQVKKRLRDAESQIISEIFLIETVRDRITEEAVRKSYEERKASFAGGDQVKARHILLETEEVAREVIAEMVKGGDFAGLAAKHSTGPSAASGGDLGWFAEGQMVPEFSTAAFALAPGEFTTEPVKTQFGWHVILVEDRKTAEAPPFEQARQQLASDMSERILREMLEALRKETKVEQFNFDGGPMPQAPKLKP